MPLNPLLDDIHTLLLAQTRPITEHTLIKALPFSEHALQTSQVNDANLILFRKHFLVMNALYTLQPRLWAQGWRLNISPLAIFLTARETLPEQASNQTLPLDDGEQAVRDYYLDWSAFDSSSAESVEALLKGFYNRNQASAAKQDALDVLKLDENASTPEIRLRYRKLAAEHHPDRGGDSERFRQVRAAYETLMQ